MNGITQNAHQKLVSRIEEVLPAIIAEAVETETAPLKAEVESCHALVNETQDQAGKRVQEALDALSSKQNEIIGLRAELEDARAKIANAATQLGEQQAKIAELKADYDEIKLELANTRDRSAMERTAIVGSDPAPQE